MLQIIKTMNTILIPLNLYTAISNGYSVSFTSPNPITPNVQFVKATPFSLPIKVEVFSDGIINILFPQQHVPGRAPSINNNQKSNKS